MTIVLQPGTHLQHEDLREWLQYPACSRFIEIGPEHGEIMALLLTTRKLQHTKEPWQHKMLFPVMLGVVLDSIIMVPLHWLQQ